ncbi:HTH-type transcriptional regulator GltC [Roseovarius litorisediminis]|uniref:HTH-type transcriptional regulator GltC n=2 Tax=Roseovarius litorisediminis TaxID=1312363 RepID=A0A1Y5RPU6_9RHOB|nr:HTH-type transcriptional regulator GltC [Roseovarius litorisediminis]
MTGFIQINLIRFYIKYRKSEDMQTRALRSLLKISQVGSFLHASEQLNMTLSALSMQMKALEAELDVVLFDRSVRPPRLTPIGRAVVERARDVVGQENALLELCSQDGNLAGKFRIGFVTSAAARLLPDFLENTQNNLPRAAFEFETGLSVVLQEKVRTGNLDAAIVTDAEINPRGLKQAILRDEPFVFAAHSSIASQGLDTLIEQHMFFHFMPQTGIGKLIASAMEQIDRPATAATVMLDNIEAIVGCVKSGLGFTLLPDPDVTRYSNDDVVKLRAPNNIRRTLILVTRSDNLLAKHLDLLSSQFGAKKLGF